MSNKFPKPWHVEPDTEKGFAVIADNGNIVSRYFKTEELAQKRIDHGFTDKQFQHRIKS